MRLLIKITIFFFLFFICYAKDHDVFAAQMNRQSYNISVHNFSNKFSQSENIQEFEKITSVIINDLKKNAGYSVYESSSNLEIAAIGDSSYQDYISSLRDESRQSNSDFIVTGTFTVTGEQAQVDCHIFIARLNQIIRISSSKIIGNKYVRELAEDVALKVSFEIQKFITKESYLPVINPTGGKYDYGTKVTIESPVKDAEIFYTLDGSTPGPENGEKYEGQIDVEKTSNLQAVLYKSDWIPSDIVSEQYRVKYRVSPLALTFYYGTISYRHSKNRMRGIFDSQITSALITWEWANIFPVRSVPFIRDFGFYAMLDNGHCPETSKISNQAVNDNFIGATGGLFYKLRMGRLFFIDFLGGLGYYRQDRILEKNYKSMDFFMPYKSKSMNNTIGLYGNGSAFFNVLIDPITISLGPSIKYQRMGKEYNLFYSYQAGIGIRF